MNNSEELYGERYYNNYGGRPYVRTKEWLDFFSSIAECIRAKLNPNSVLDAGCAKGFLVETLRDRGIDARGIDVSEYAINEVYAPIRPYCEVASIIEPFPKKFDLIVCIEVVEHMPPIEAAKAIQNMCEHTETILFSSTPTEFSEATHINVQLPEYWVKEFGYHGFYHDLDFDASFLTSWAMLFRRQRKVLADLAFDYERNRIQLRIENADLRRKNIDLEARVHYLEQSQVSASNPDINPYLELLKSNNNALGQKVEELEAQLASRLSEINALSTENTEIRSSTSWRITQPVRSVINLFKKDNRKA